MLSNEKHINKRREGNPVVVLTLRKASNAPFSMYSMTIMTGFPDKQKRETPLDVIRSSEDKLHPLSVRGRNEGK